MSSSSSRRSPFATGLLLASLCLTAGLPAAVVINEIHYAPSDNTKPVEFIELHNSGAAPVDLSGWRISDGVAFTFPAGTSLAAGGYAVVAQNPAAFQTQFGFAPLGPFTGALTSRGERVQIRDATDAVVDEVTYQAGFPWPTGAAGAGASMELMHPSMDNNLGGSWRSSGSNVLPEPPVTYIAAEDTQWRYRFGTTEPSTPSSAWRLTGFTEDASWLTGQTSIGYADKDDNTIITGMTGNFWSISLRHGFTVAPGKIPAALLLRARVDDGCVVWINGHLAGQFHMPVAEPNITSAAENHEAGTAFEEIVIANAGSFLVEGENMVAIHAANSSLGSSDFTIDCELKSTSATQAGSSPTPGARNSVFSVTAPPVIRQVAHTPQVPAGGQAVTVSAKITDADGVAAATLRYQIVNPGSYIRKSDAAYATAWVDLPMTDDGGNGDLVAGDGIFTATVPASVQTHRRLIRYRMSATDAAGGSVQVPYEDDECPDFGYFVYDGIPAWSGANQQGGAQTTFSPSLLNTLPTYHLIADGTDVINSQYNSGFDTVRMWGTLVYEGKVYDHIRFHNKGSASTYVSGKNKWRFHFNRAREFAARDSWGRLYEYPWDTFAMNGCASPWGTVHRGMAGLDEMISTRVYQLAGVPSPNMHHLHFRVVDNAVEASPTSQYEGDEWGLYLAVEDPDGSFLKERNLPDGNVYHIAGGSGEKTHQGETHPLTTADWSAFQSGSTNGSQTEQWWRDNMDLPSYFSFRAGNRIVGNVDLREGWNHYFYHRGSDNRWMPVPWDLDMQFYPETHWSGTIDQRNCLNRPAIMIEYRNRCRELLDLLCADATPAGGQIGQLLDEYYDLLVPAGETSNWSTLDQYMWNYHPRTTSKGTFYKTPVGDSRIGGSWTRTLASPDFAGMVKYIVDYTTDTDPNTFAVGDGDQRGYGYNYLEFEANDTGVPGRPSVIYTGPAGFAADTLTFQSSAFAAAASGSTGFQSMQWRLGEIAAPGIAFYVAGEPRTYEIEELWTSGVLTTFSADVTVPLAAVRPGHTYRLRVRHADANGRGSRWSEAVEFTAGLPDVSPWQQGLMITEVNYNPQAASAAELAAGYSTDDFEFLELKNIGATALLLTDLRFTKGIDFDFPAGRSVAPGEFVLVVKNAAAFRFRYGTGLDTILAGEWGAANLSNGGEQVKLSYGAGTAIHDFIYDDAAPWPTQADGQGNSLVLADPASSPDHALAASWRASWFPLGSPGRDDVLTYATWAAARPGTGDAQADDDLDGLTNDMEYAFGGNPLAPESPSAVLPAGGVTVLTPPDGTPGRYLTVSVRRREGMTDIVCTPEFSTDLDVWTGGGILVSTAPGADGTVTDFWRAPEPVSAASRAFVRVRLAAP